VRRAFFYDGSTLQVKPPKHLQLVSGSTPVIILNQRPYSATFGVSCFLNSTQAIAPKIRALTFLTICGTHMSLT
jgi:hypothetical protein